MASSTLKGNQRRYEYELLCRLREVLPAGVKVTVVADRGFADCKLFYALTTELAFEYVIRLRGDIYVTNARGERRAAAAWVGAGGRAQRLVGARVTDTYELPVGVFDASRAVAMLSSLAEAQAQLRSEGIALDIKTLRSTAYRYAARARAAQQSAACGLLDRVTGKRVVVSLDGGRVRVRRKKRGPKTKKGRNRFHTDWKEPKLLILYVVGDDGRPSQTWAPIIDGTLRGPEAVFALLLSYARQIGLNAADKVLFIADGAPWIWQRIQRLIAALGLSPTQVLGLIDFYHAAKQLSDAVKLRRWSATQRTRWLNRTRGLLKRARVDEVITALRELCRGRTAGKIRTHLNYFLKNRHRFAYTTMVGLGLPQGSGAVESAIRRVINLRIKGASIYWLPESVDAILLLRSFYKSGRWNCLQRMAMTPVGVSA